MVTIMLDTNFCIPAGQVVLIYIYSLVRGAWMHLATQQRHNHLWSLARRGIAITTLATFKRVSKVSDVVGERYFGAFSQEDLIGVRDAAGKRELMRSCIGTNSTTFGIFYQQQGCNRVPRSRIQPMSVPHVVPEDCMDTRSATW